MKDRGFCGRGLAGPAQSQRFTKPHTALSAPRRSDARAKAIGLLNGKLRLPHGAEMSGVHDKSAQPTVRLQDM